MDSPGLKAQALVVSQTQFIGGKSSGLIFGATVGMHERFGVGMANASFVKWSVRTPLIWTDLVPRIKNLYTRAREANKSLY